MKSFLHKIMSRLRIRAWTRANASRPLWVHVGAGTNVIPEWLNTDCRRMNQCVFLDVSKPLPFQDGTIDSILAEHVISSLSKSGVQMFFGEAFRCLKKGGVLRISIPNLTAMCRALCTPDLFSERERVLKRHQKLFRLGEEISFCDVFNDMAYMWNHRYLLSEEELVLLLQAAGFTAVEKVSYRQSRHPHLRNLECRSDADDFAFVNLIIEVARN